MNKENLKLVREKILEFHENFDYGHALDHKKLADATSSYKYSCLLIHHSPVCGCVIGYSLALNNRRSDSRVWLDLTDDQEMFLFQPLKGRRYKDDTYLNDYRSEIYPSGYSYTDQGDDKDAYKEAISRIDYLLAQGA